MLGEEEEKVLSKQQGLNVLTLADIRLAWLVLVNVSICDTQKTILSVYHVMKHLGLNGRQPTKQNICGVNKSEYFTMDDPQNNS